MGLSATHEPRAKPWQAHRKRREIEAREGRLGRIILRHVQSRLPQSLDAPLVFDQFLGSTCPDVPSGVECRSRKGDRRAPTKISFSASPQTDANQNDHQSPNARTGSRRIIFARPAVLGLPFANNAPETTKVPSRSDDGATDRKGRPGPSRQQGP